MPEVTLRGFQSCVVCGYQQKILIFAGVDVLMTQLRQREGALCIFPTRCTECGWRGDYMSCSQHYRLDAGDMAKVDRIRERRRARRKAA